ncbi:MAG: hypothetical protein AB7F89_04155, partial [Pirellulaceae bacterium]
MSNVLVKSVEMESPSLDELLRTIDSRPTASAYQSGAHALRNLRERLRPIRVGILATFTAEPLIPFLEVESARLGFAADIYQGPFNAVRQELLDPGSGCIAHDPRVVIIAQLLEDVCPPLVDDFLGLSGDEIDGHVTTLLASMRGALETFRRHSSAAVVLHNFALPSQPA